VQNGAGKDSRKSEVKNTMKWVGGVGLGRPISIYSIFILRKWEAYVKVAM